MIKISDLYMKSYIEAKGIECREVDMELVNGRKTVLFLFEDTEEVHELIDEFQNSSFVRDCIRLYLRTKRQITKKLNE